MRLQGSLAFALLIILCGLPALAAPEFIARECSGAAAEAGARCGIVHVPENYAKPRSRKIPLNVIVLPATGKPLDTKRAQYDLEGGPGFAATDFLAFYATDGAVYRANRDIVLADMRGTGASNPLRCAGIEEQEKRDPWAPLYPPDLVAECAAQLAVANDPTSYSTGAAARDIDEVRRALGYTQLDLNAISYGTTLAMRYIADYPRAVHSAALMGTVPAARTPPRFHAIAAERALLMLAVDCEKDAVCRKTGDLATNLKAAINKLPKDRPLAGDAFMERLRSHLYGPFSARKLPAVLRAAAHGDFDAGLDTCLDATIIRLFDTGDVNALDTNCFAAMESPPFDTP